MQFFNAFWVGGLLCVIAQLLIDYTKMTPAKIMVTYVVSGVVLTAIGIYEPIVRYAGSGATVPIIGFGYTLAKGVEKLVAERQPPLSRLKRPMKIKFARQTGRHPMRITINVGGASDIPESYTRYLRRGLAMALKWEHLPIVIEYEKSDNPYD